jgi:hypothetical protein
MDRGNIGEAARLRYDIDPSKFGFMATNYENTAALVETPFSLRKYLYYSTLVGVFSGGALLRIGIGFDLQLFYLLMIGNLLLMLLLAQFSIPKRLVLLALYLLASGFIGIRNGTDSVGLFVKQFLGIVISAFYFYNFFQLQDNRVQRAFHHYAIGAYWASIAGFIILPLQIVFTRQSRLQSVFLEPSHYTMVCIPALYYFACHWLVHRKYGRQVVVMLLAFAFSVSALGVLGIAFGLFLILSRYRFWKLAAPLLIAGFIGIVCLASSEFRLRVVDTVVAIQKSDVEGSNLSTFALMANLFVTTRVFEDNPIFGHGLGSHPMSHAYYLEEIPGIQSFIDVDAERLNATDAASLFLRSLSELGLVGVIGILTFIWYFHVPGHGPHAQISDAIFIYFFLKLLRSGIYFGPEQFFFILVYILNFRHYKAGRELPYRISVGNMHPIG